MNILASFLSDPLVHAFGWALIHSLWIGVVAALLLAWCLRVAENASGSIRYILSCLTLAGFVGLTVLAGFRHYNPQAVWDTGATLPADLSTQPATYLSVETSASLDVQVTPAAISPAGSLRGWVEHTVVPWLTPLWFAGLLAVSVRLLIGWFAMHRLRHAGTRRVDASIEQTAQALCKSLKVWPTVRMFESPRAASPMLIGWLRPVILLPVACLTGLSQQQLGAVIAHELAHVRRHDYLVNLIQCLCETLLFYHPAAWWIGRVIRQERERCCDELVVNITGDRVGYARALLHIAESPQPKGRFQMASQGGDLTARIRRLIVCEPQPRHSRWSTGLWSALMCVSVAGVFVAATVAQEHPPANDPAELIGVLLEGENTTPEPATVPQQTIIDVNYKKLLSGDPTQNVVIRPDDLIKIITSGQLGYVYIQGEVKRPGAYGLPGYNELTLKQLIVSTGGYPADGAPVFAELIRRSDNDTEQTLHFSINDLFDGWSQDTYLAPNDLVLLGHEPGPEDEAAKTRRLLREQINVLSQTVSGLRAERDAIIKELGEGHPTVNDLDERIVKNGNELAEARAKLSPAPDKTVLKIRRAPDPTGRPPLPGDLAPSTLPNLAAAGDRVIVTAYHLGGEGEKTTFDRLLDEDGTLHLPGIAAVPFVGLPITKVQGEVCDLMKRSASYRQTEHVTVTLPNKWLYTVATTPVSGGGPIPAYPITDADFRLNDALLPIRRTGGLPEDIKVVRIIRYEPAGTKKKRGFTSP